MKTIISVKNAAYQYTPDSARVLDDVSFDVYEGEFLAVLGRNGSGKSTLAKLLNALFLPTDGAVYVDGIDTREEDKLFTIRALCGMVFQNPDNQLVASIVEEDVAFGLENLGVEPHEMRTRVYEAIERVGLTPYKNRAPHMLSGGQKQRVAIAGILAMRPRIIVFDEATAMLDPSGRLDVLDIVKRLNREEGITVVWITHFMEEAAQADRVLVMDHGKIAMLGAPKQVFSQVDEVKVLGLDVPEMAQLNQTLINAGLELPHEILTIDEMVEALCQLKSKT